MSFRIEHLEGLGAILRRVDEVAVCLRLRATHYGYALWPYGYASWHAQCLRLMSMLFLLLMSVGMGGVFDQGVE